MNIKTIRRSKLQRARASRNSNYNRAYDFAANLANTLRMRRRTAVLSIKTQFHLTTRQARQAFDAAKTPKHRKRS
jgi:hypothetical protein